MTKPRIQLERMQEVLGKAPKPEKVWEQQFDDFYDELAKMARMDWAEIPEEFMWYYWHDLTYVELQPDLFRHLFPACLKFGYTTLMRDEPATRGDADFHNALMRGQFVEKMLSAAEREKLQQFFIDGLLDRVEAQTLLKVNGKLGETSSRDQHNWIWRFNTLGIVAPVIAPIWESWWSLDQKGKANCAILYASGLIYCKGENPIYGTWTPDKGGGGPYLSEIDASIFDWAWRDDNLAFLKNILSVEYLLQKLEQAIPKLENTTDLAVLDTMLKEAKKRTDIVQIRIDDLIEDLARVQLEKKRHY